MTYIDAIATSDSLQYLRQLPTESIDCCVTSPPYYGLRNYGMDGQIGLEETPEAFISRLVEVFHEVKRVLKPMGTLWVNIGDSYAGSGRGCGDTKRSSAKQESNPGSWSGNSLKAFRSKIIKPKDLIGIPWMLAFALRADGWYLRQDIIWSKPNPMPESVTDRCTKSHEYIFLLSKSPIYYFNQEAIRVPLKDTSIARLAQDIENQQESDRAHAGVKTMKAVRFGGNKYGDSQDPFARTKSGKGWNPTMDGSGTANKRTVWEVATTPFRDAHFAVYPEKLIVDCILAGCPENGVVLDPFMGSGTTAVVAKKLNRHFAGCDLNPEYVEIANKRLANEIGLFL